MSGNNTKIILSVNSVVKKNIFIIVTGSNFDWLP